MAENLYEAGIVITADSGPATEAMGQLISDMSIVDDRLKELSSISGFGGVADQAESAAANSEEFTMMAKSAEEADKIINQLVKGLQGAGDNVEIISEEFGNLSTSGSEAMESTEEAAKNLDKELGEKEEDVSTLGKVFKWLGGTGTEAFKEILSGALDLYDAVSDLDNTLESLVGGGMFQLDQQATRLHERLGQGEKASQEFKDTVLELSDATEITPEIIGDLAFNLRAAGLAFDTATDSSQRAAKVLSHMVGSLGVSVDEVTAFAAAARLMGASVGDMADDAIYFEKVFNIPELMEEMPGITQDVIKVQSQFGRDTVHDARRVSKAVTRMAGVYAKALGKTAAEAARDAREAFAAFAGETQAYRDVFLGLADDFTPLQTAFLETGMGVKELGSLMMEAQTNQTRFVERVKAIHGTLDRFRGERFLQQVIRNTTGGVKQMLIQERALQSLTGEARKAALARIEEQRAAQRNQEEFNTTIISMRDNVIDLYQRFQSLWRVFITSAALDFSGAIEDAFIGLVKWAHELGKNFKSLRAYFKGSDEALEGWGETAKTAASYIRDLFGEDKQERIENFKQVVSSVIKTTIQLTTTIGTLAAVLTPALAFFKPIAGVVGAIAKMFFKLSKGASTASKVARPATGAFRVFGAAIGKIALPIGIAISLFEGFKDRIGNIGDAIKDADWDRLFNEIFGGIGESINAFFLGIPRMIIDAFSGGSEAVSPGEANKVGEFIGKIIGAASKFVIKATWDLIEAMQFAVNTPEGRSRIKKGLRTLYTAIVEVGKGLFKGIGKEIMEDFGLPWESIKTAAKLGMLKLTKLLIEKFTGLSFWLVKILAKTADKAAEILGLGKGDYFQKAEKELEGKVSDFFAEVTGINDAIKEAQSKLDAAAIAEATKETKLQELNEASVALQKRAKYLTEGAQRFVEAKRALKKIWMMYVSDSISDVEWERRNKSLRAMLERYRGAYELAETQLPQIESQLEAIDVRRQQLGQLETDVTMTTAPTEAPITEQPREGLIFEGEHQGEKLQLGMDREDFSTLAARLAVSEGGVAGIGKVSKGIERLADLIADLSAEDKGLAKTIARAIGEAETEKLALYGEKAGFRQEGQAQKFANLITTIAPDAGARDLLSKALLQMLVVKVDAKSPG